MLPRLLCEELCSLNPNEDRLTFSVIWKLTAAGEVVKFYDECAATCCKLKFSIVSDCCSAGVCKLNCVQNSLQLLPCFFYNILLLFWTS